MNNIANTNIANIPPDQRQPQAPKSIGDNPKYHAIGKDSVLSSIIAKVSSIFSKIKSKIKEAGLWMLSCLRCGSLASKRTKSIERVRDGKDDLAEMRFESIKKMSQPNQDEIKSHDFDLKLDINKLYSLINSLEYTGENYSQQVNDQIVKCIEHGSYKNYPEIKEYLQDINHKIQLEAPIGDVFENYAKKYIETENKDYSPKEIATKFKKALEVSTVLQTDNIQGRLVYGIAATDKAQFSLKSQTDPLGFNPRKNTNNAVHLKELDYSFGKIQHIIRPNAVTDPSLARALLDEMRERKETFIYQNLQHDGKEPEKIRNQEIEKLFEEYSDVVIYFKTPVNGKFWKSKELKRDDLKPKTFFNNFGAKVLTNNPEYVVPEEYKKAEALALCYCEGFFQELWDNNSDTINSILNKKKGTVRLSKLYQQMFYTFLSYHIKKQVSKNNTGDKIYATNPCKQNIDRGGTQTFMEVAFEKYSKEESFSQKELNKLIGVTLFRPNSIGFRNMKNERSNLIIDFFELLEGNVDRLKNLLNPDD